MGIKLSRADVAQIRQTTQYTCCAASIASALQALGKRVTEDDVNKVLGAAPMAGATWEAMLATVQYFGCRGTLVVPATPKMLKAWTDQGIPVIIAWNPENRPWSHASTVFDVVESEGKLWVHVMDSNIPNPDETTRIMDVDSFCQKWGEKVSDSLIVRRPAMAVTLEVSPEGRQVIASSTKRVHMSSSKEEMIQNISLRHMLAKKPTPVVQKKDPNQVKGPGAVPRNPVVQNMIEKGWGSGSHQNRDFDVEKGRARKEKHKKDWRDKDSAESAKQAASKMSLPEFLKAERKKLEEFERYWKQENKQSEDNFPMEMMSGDWDEQLAIFQS